MAQNSGVEVHRGNGSVDNGTPHHTDAPAKPSKGEVKAARKAQIESQTVYHKQAPKSKSQTAANVIVHGGSNDQRMVTITLIIAFMVWFIANLNKSGTQMKIANPTSPVAKLYGVTFQNLLAWAFILAIFMAASDTGMADLAKSFAILLLIAILIMFGPDSIDLMLASVGGTATTTAAATTTTKPPTAASTTAGAQATAQ